MVFSKKTEVFSVKEFMNRTAKTPKMPNLPIYSFLPAVSLKTLIPISDPTFALFLAVTGGITAIALIEKILELCEIEEVAEFINTTMKIFLPIAGFGSVIWLLFQI